MHVFTIFFYLRYKNRLPDESDIGVLPHIQIYIMLYPRILES